MENFSQYIESSDPIIQQAANDLSAATTDLQVGSITKDEYKELCNDILDESMLASLISDIDRLQEIYSTFKSMTDIVSIITAL